RLETMDQFAQWLKNACLLVADVMQEKREGVSWELKDRIADYIQNTGYGAISLDHAADALGVSSGYLSRVFKSVFAMSFTDYVIDKKLEQATEMLAQEDLTVKEISVRLGYNSAQYFTRIFKEKYGYTPKQYQRGGRTATP
ncbi:MAG TPA: AraC family transcriptional regulator, partial [Clostridia bacterium]|nr:AraC family transcriptional regulator [Clostridia bacterium]